VPVAICAPTGDVVLQTSRDASGDHVGNEISPWLEPATGTTDVPLGWVTTSRPWPSTMARRPGNRGSTSAALSAGRVVEAAVVVAPERVVVDDEREVVVVAPGRVVVVVVVVDGSAKRARVVVDGRAVGGLRS
jgi:hypothetical protein